MTSNIIIKLRYTLYNLIAGNLLRHLMAKNIVYLGGCFL